jgi:hypothetical protein
MPAHKYTKKIMEPNKGNIAGHNQPTVFGIDCSAGTPYFAAHSCKNAGFKKLWAIFDRLFYKFGYKPLVFPVGPFFYGLPILIRLTYIGPIGPTIQFVLVKSFLNRIFGMQM